MYICICNGVTDRAIRAAVAEGAATISDVTQRLGVAAGCGCCREAAQQVIHEAACGGRCGSCSRHSLATA
jgi:bacterioferritin-associated ferredoxin